MARALEAEAQGVKWPMSAYSRAVEQDPQRRLQASGFPEQAAFAALSGGLDSCSIRLLVDLLICIGVFRLGCPYAFTANPYIPGNLRCVPPWRPEKLFLCTYEQY